MALLVACVSLAVVVWVYAGYPALLAALGRVRPRPRARAPVDVPLSVVVPAHNEASSIAAKVANVRAAAYGRPVQVIVASDGSTDGTADAARAAGADVVLDLPRSGKTSTLVAAVERAHGEILVFTDADSLLEPSALVELTSAFADPAVGGVSGSEVRRVRSASGGVARGEGLYWRYEHLLKRLEDRVGSTVSAAGGLYAIRASLFRAPQALDGADDFVLSTEVVRAGYRLVFEQDARVALELPEEGGRELARKVRVMNQGIRAALALGPLLLPRRGGLYAVQVVSHKLLRRLVPFFLLALLVASAVLARNSWAWAAALALQLCFYGLAVGGLLAERTGRAGHRLLWIPYYFCLANAAAAVAVLSVLAGVRYTQWEPERPAERAAGADAREGRAA